jgi:hypothetical protein
LRFQSQKVTLFLITFCGFSFKGSMDVTTGSLAVLSEKLERYDERDDLFKSSRDALPPGWFF